MQVQRAMPSPAHHPQQLVCLSFNPSMYLTLEMVPRKKWRQIALERSESSASLRLKLHPQLLPLLLHNKFRQAGRTEGTRWRSHRSSHCFSPGLPPLKAAEILNLPCLHMTAYTSLTAEDLYVCVCVFTSNSWNCEALVLSLSEFKTASLTCRKVCGPHSSS